MISTLEGKSKKDRFDIKDGKTTMKAVVTNGNGGYEMLEYRDVPVPALAPGEVLLQVLAAGVNNTEINTRLGWYSSAVTTGTDALSAGEKKKAKAKADAMANLPVMSAKPVAATWAPEIGTIWVDLPRKSTELKIAT